MMIRNLWSAVGAAGLATVLLVSTAGPVVAADDPDPTSPVTQSATPDPSSDKTEIEAAEARFQASLTNDDGTKASVVEDDATTAVESDASSTAEDDGSSDTAGDGSVSTSDVEQERQMTPIKGGTELRFPDEKNCTAGMVLKKNGLWANLSSYRKAIRYVVTAGHCGSIGDPVIVANRTRGKVIWKSGISDLMLIRVLPSYYQTSHCGIGGSGAPNCIYFVHTHPLAVSRVLTDTLQARGLSSVPITEVRNGAPATGTFCTSGKTTGVNCTWTTTDLPPDIDHAAGGTLAAATSPTAIDDGDSGGPVYDTVNGLIYGIIKATLIVSETTTVYVKAQQFFTETGSTYSLAPSS